MSKRIPVPLEQILARELARGERVLWVACPISLDRVRASTGDVVGGILALAIAVVFTLSPSGHLPRTATDGSPFGMLFGGIVALAGVRMLLSPLVAWWDARHTLYAITDRRAILIRDLLRGLTLQSFAGETLTGVVRRERRSGFGDLIFEREASKGAKGRTIYRDVGFLGIRDPWSVERLLPVQITRTPIESARA